MQGRLQLTTIARFYCGCAYRTLGDQTVFCPEHRREPHRGFITGEETIGVPGKALPDIRELAMNPLLPGAPITLLEVPQKPPIFQSEVK